MKTLNAIIFICLFSSSFLPAQTTVINASHDCYVSSESPNNSYNGPFLWIGHPIYNSSWESIVCLKFDLPYNLGTIVKAQLIITDSAGCAPWGFSNARIQYFANTWYENTITYNSLMSHLGSGWISFNPGAGAIVFDMPLSKVQSWVSDPATNFGFSIMNLSTAAGSLQVYYSKEYWGNQPGPRMIIQSDSSITTLISNVTGVNITINPSVAGIEQYNTPSVIPLTKNIAYSLIAPQYASDTSCMMFEHWKVNGTIQTLSNNLSYTPVSGQDTLEAVYQKGPFVELNIPTEFCQYYPSFLLTGGTPTGGVYSGPGVISSGQSFYFFPTDLALGSYPLVYSYSDATQGCTSSDTALVTINPCIGISENHPDELKFCIYPNPGNGIFTIDFQNNTKKTSKVEVLNSLGKLILSKNYNPGINSLMELDLQSYPNGNYNVVLTQGQKSYLQKIVIQ